MFRIQMSLIAGAFWVAVSPLAASAQMPPPEGAPQPNNPYAQPYGPPPSTTTTATNPKMLARAKTWFAELQSGSIDRAQLSSSASANLTDATISNARSMIGRLGAPVSFVQQRAGTQGGVSYGIYLVTFKNGQKLDFLFAVDGTGKVTSLGLGSPH